MAFSGLRVSLKVPEKNHVARKASEARPVSPKGSKSQLGWNEPESFGLDSRFPGLTVTMLVTLVVGFATFIDFSWRCWDLYFVSVSRSRMSRYSLGASSGAPCLLSIKFE